MKFVLTWTGRAGASAADSVVSGESAQKLLANWKMSEAATMHQWLTRCDGNGGFAVVETDDAAALYKDIAVWSPWLNFGVYPVLDIGDSAPLGAEALSIARSVI